MNRGLTKNSGPRRGAHRLVPYQLLVACCVTLQFFTPELGAVTVKSVSSPIYRLEDGPAQIKLDKDGRFLAFTATDGVGLNVIELQNGKVHSVTKEYVGSSYFWAPDGFRLFYRAQSRSAAKPDVIESTLAAWDAKLTKSVTLETIAGPTGLLTFDPRDLRMYLMQSAGILTKRISFPDERLARWQRAQRTEKGRWIATQNGMLWVTQAGFAMRRLDDDGSPLESFSLSPDGSTAAWATTLGNIWVSQNGDTPKKLDKGRDPSWHPEKPYLLYAGARMLGNKVVNYNLKVSDLKGSTRFLTYNQIGSERWPQWHKDGSKIYFTQEKSTDIFRMDFSL